LLLCQQLFFYRDLWVWLDDPFQSPQALAGVHDDARADMVEMPGTGAQLWLNWFLVDLNPAYQGAQSLSPVAIPSVRPAVGPQMWKATLSRRLNALSRFRRRHSVDHERWALHQLQTLDTQMTSK
jgi:hypothetical protein